MSLIVTAPGFVREYQQKKWSEGGDGPDDFNCYNLVRSVYRTQWHIELPAMMITAENIKRIITGIKDESVSGRWEKIEKPEHGCVAVFHPGSQPLHVGVWLCYDGGGVLHACRKHNVTYLNLVALKNIGFPRPEFYRYVGGKTTGGSSIS